MADISVTNALDDNAANSDITLVGTNFTEVIDGLTDGTKDISISQVTVASKILMANGTSALPSYTFAGDLNTGVYWAGADNMGFVTGGTSRFDISTTTLDFNLATFDATSQATEMTINTSNAAAFKITGSSNVYLNCNTTAGTVTLGAAGTVYPVLPITDTNGAVEAAIWYDASENKLKFFNGTGVETITSAV